MGNDDLMCSGALAGIADAIKRNAQCGVVVRSYASFEGSSDTYKQVFRYFPQEYVLRAGEQAIATAYRRSVVISGMVVHRDAAYEAATTQFDGTLLYQLYLVGIILAKKSVVFVPQIIALRRDGIPPDFGNSATERGKFVPHDQTPESSIHFMQGMLNIADYVASVTGLSVFSAIRSDLGHYSYPVLSIQAKRPLWVFLRYGLKLAGLGLWRYPLFHIYFIALLLIGPEKVDRVINHIKNKLGYTPRLGTARGAPR
jgi:hypothetical protein